VASLKERLTARVEELRTRRPVVDHLVRTVQHYGDVKGGLQAGAVTYFAFLSLFPILALAFFAVGLLAQVYPDARADLIEAIDGVLPGLIGEGDGQLSLDTIEGSAGTVGLLGLVGVLYAGLGWLSGMRTALRVMFESPSKTQRGFVGGKLIDLLSMVVIGLVLVVSVAVSGLVSTYSQDVLDWLGIGRELSPLLVLLTVLIGLAANMLLFYVMFRLLGEPELPSKALWSGALLGALGFEVLKRLSSLLLAATKSSPGVQAFGVTLILLVWINYSTRLVMYAAAWAQTSREARATRESVQLAHAVKDASAWVSHDLPPMAPDSAAQAPDGLSRPRTAFAAGGASMLALMAVVRRIVNRKDRS
jgi:membrane protein